MPTAHSTIALLTPSVSGTTPNRREGAAGGAPGGFSELMRDSGPASGQGNTLDTAPRTDQGNRAEEGGKPLPPEGEMTAADGATAPESESSATPDHGASAAAAAAPDEMPAQAASEVAASLAEMLQLAAGPAPETTPDGAGEAISAGDDVAVEAALPQPGAAPAVMAPAATSHAPAAQASAIAVAASGTAAAIATATGAVKGDGTPGQTVKLAVAAALAAQTSDPRGGAGTALTGRSAPVLQEPGMTGELLAQTARNLAGSATMTDSDATAGALALASQTAARRADPAALRTGDAPTTLLADGTVARPSIVSPGAALTSAGELPPLVAQSRNFDQLLGERMLWMVNQRLQNAEIRLSPAHLGSIEVRLSMSGEQASVQFLAASAATRETLEASMPRLREMFAAAGLELRDSGVHDQQTTAHQERDGSRAPWAVADGDGESGDAEMVAGSVALRPRGLVDFYA